MGPDQKVVRIAERQHSVFSRAQALSCGLTPRQIDSRLCRGLWLSMYRGVYKLRGSPATFETSVTAALLATGDGAAASHVSAGRLWALDGFTNACLHVTIPDRRRVTVPGVNIHRPRSLTRKDITTIGAISATTPSRTLIDLAGSIDECVLEDAIDDFARRGRIDVSRLLTRVKSTKKHGRRGLISLVGLLEDRVGKPVSGSSRENSLRRLLEAAGLPALTPQHEVRTPEGLFVARVDFAYPDAKIFVEFDGYANHSSRKQWESDLLRQNRLVELGWQPLRITAWQVDRQPERVIAQVWGVLTTRGVVVAPQTSGQQRFGAS